MNRYPLWKYLILLVALALGLIYALPNVYAPDPAIQISGQSSSLQIGEAELANVRTALAEKNIEFKSVVLEDNRVLVRLPSREAQLLAKTAAQNTLGLDNYVVALNLAPTTPQWLRSIGAGPMKLGLDLSGGVHFLMEVDTEAAIETRLRSMVSTFKTDLRKEKVRGVVQQRGSAIEAKFRTEELRDKASSLALDNMPEMTRRKGRDGEQYTLVLELGEAAITQMEDEAVSQNLVTLRNRVNELGVSEPLVQRQGRSRIVIELPGVQDTAAAKRILGKTANLEFRLQARTDANSYDKEAFPFEGGTAYLERDIIVTGEQVVGARAGFDENSAPQVNIDLSAEGGQIMHRVTRHAVKRRMGVLFIERKTRKAGTSIDESGDTVPVYEEYYDKRIINLATIQSALGAAFRITGLDSQAESAELALLLRAGALAAPMRFIEERTIGPSLGAENIALGVKSVVIGLALVVVCMLAVYKVFGFAANIALAVNMILIVAVMSILGATLTLPGIAGIVLTVGMAVDANVLIFSRIREELVSGAKAQTAIKTGFERAFVTIRDANLTTLLAAIILYGVGTGPIKGFAVTLSIGILTSMFTAIMGTRAIVNLMYGNRRSATLHI
ncbi:MAG: protein translocase subunit SecD [Gammaproteobacteria bacterium]|nr:protein translocase subunit SecD [Gammaproteobacteria bacterium]NND38335.1 protein translocase subunit SecD [Pseudomonadales bacterium]NNL10737.1 protein translocase subunit SecD [Pseudomonadales bacterium]NNM12007.1 protein translocase subunit SecD [Pseudomonadales bacterium]RZV60167.1 MAG: protein translocase subunit SecD [Pseudomonadales bacterium]